MDVFGDVVTGLLPTVGVTLLFAAAIWAIVRADAAERTGRARVEAEEDAADRAASEAAQTDRTGTGRTGTDRTGTEGTRPPE